MLRGPVRGALIVSAAVIGTNSSAQYLFHIGTVLFIEYAFMAVYDDPNVVNLSNVYNMSGNVVSDLQFRAEGEKL